MGVEGAKNYGAAKDAQGRPTKLTPQRHHRIVQLIRNGNYIDVACAAAGLDSRSYYKWCARGRELLEVAELDLERDLDQPSVIDAVWEWNPKTLIGPSWSMVTEYEAACVRFLQDIIKANAEAEATAVLHVREQMPTNWAAAMTYLERKHPGRWKRRDEITVANPFDPTQQADTGQDERAMLEDPEAIRLIHEALIRVSRGELAAHTGPEAEALKGEIVDATVVEE